MTTIRNCIFYIICAAIFLVVSCKKDKSPKTTVPELTTTTVSNITANTATSGGTITGNGGETITFSGICWSTTNQNPTISDDTTKGNTATGSFTAMLTDLNSSSTYYVRAYATNRVGTGYGNVVTFTTGNAAPLATAISITGTPKGDELLTGTYTYSDADGDAEAGTTFQWYVADDGTGTGETLIDGATEKTFRVQNEQEGKYIRFGVTPKAGAGNQNGTEVKSTFTTAVGEATTVTFTYNNAEVTYGIIVGPSGKKWLDRNLGASRVAQSATDYQAYGDYFQWGRLSDGHQLATRTNETDDGAVGVTGVSSETTDQDVPPVNTFILNTSTRGDWRSPQNSELWQGVNGVNNPCPEGWRIATEAEWTAESITTLQDGFDKLKLTRNGTRDLVYGTWALSDEMGVYWSSTVKDDRQRYAIQARFDATSSMYVNNNRAYGAACRCIRN